MGILVLILVAATVYLVVRVTHPWRRSADGQPRSRWLSRGVVAGAIVVTLIPLLLLESRLWVAPTRITSSPATKRAEDPRTTDAESMVCPTSTRPPRASDRPDPKQNVLTLTLHGVDIVNDVVQIDAALCVGDQTLRHLRVGPVTPYASGIPDAHQILPTGLCKTLGTARCQALSRRVAIASFTLVLRGSVPQATSAHSVSLKSIVATPATRQQPLNPGSARLATAAGTFRVSLLGGADLFPLDVYETIANWSVELPVGEDLVFGTSHTFALPLAPLRIQSSASATGLQWYSNSNDVKAVATEGLVLRGTRGVSTALFVMLLVFLPLMLFLSAIAVLVPRGRQDPDSRSLVPAELVIGVAAFLVAVLPIRGVLVPATLPGLTVVDYVLGTEMAVMVSAVIVIAVEAHQLPLGN